MSAWPKMLWVCPVCGRAETHTSQSARYCGATRACTTRKGDLTELTKMEPVEVVPVQQQPERGAVCRDPECKTCFPSSEQPERGAEDTDFIYSEEYASDNDPIVHGNRWRAERDEAVGLLRECANLLDPPRDWSVDGFNRRSAALDIRAFLARLDTKGERDADS